MSIMPPGIDAVRAALASPEPVTLPPDLMLPAKAERVAMERRLREDRAADAFAAIGRAHPDDMRVLLAAILDDLIAVRHPGSHLGTRAESARWWSAPPSAEASYPRGKRALGALPDDRAAAAANKRLMAALLDTLTASEVEAFIAYARGGDNAGRV